MFKYWIFVWTIKEIIKVTLEFCIYDMPMVYICQIFNLFSVWFPCQNFTHHNYCTRKKTEILVTIYFILIESTWWLTISCANSQFPNKIHNVIGYIILSCIFLMNYTTLKLCNSGLFFQYNVKCQLCNWFISWANGLHFKLCSYVGLVF